MAAPAYLNVGTAGNSAGATSTSPALPASRANGNILIAIVASKNNATHSISGTGWTAVPGLAQTNSGASWRVSYWWREVDGTEAAPTISWTGSVACTSIIAQYTRAVEVPCLPFGSIGTPNTGTTSPHTSTGFTSTRNNSLAVYFDAQANNIAYAAPAGWTERFDTGSGTSSSRLGGGDKTLATAGTGSGSISITAAGAAYVQVQLELLEPIATVPGNASGAMGAPVAVTPANGSATGKAAGTGPLGGTVTATPMAGTARGKAATGGPLGATVTLSALTGNAKGKAGAAGAMGSLVTVAPIAAAATGKGNAAGALGAVVTVTAMTGTASGGAGTVPGNASGPFGATVTISAMGGTASGGVPIVPQYPDPITMPIKRRQRQQPARRDIEEAIRETEEAQKPAAPAIVREPAPAPVAEPEHDTQILALQQRLAEIIDDQAQAEILREIARIEAELHLALQWDEEAAALLLLAA